MLLWGSFWSFNQKRDSLRTMASCLLAAVSTFWVIPCRIRMTWSSKYILQRPSFSTHPTHLRFSVTYLHMDLLAPLHGTTTWTPTRDLCVLWSIKSLSTLGRWRGSNVGKCGCRFWLLKGSTAVLSWTDVPKQSMWICANPFFPVSFLRRRETWKHFSRPFASWEACRFSSLSCFQNDCSSFEPLRDEYPLIVVILSSWLVVASKNATTTSFVREWS